MHCSYSCLQHRSVSHKTAPVIQALPSAPWNSPKQPLPRRPVQFPPRHPTLFFWLMAASATHNIESGPGQVQRCGTFHSKLHIKLHLVKFSFACRSAVRGRSPRRWSIAKRSVAAPCVHQKKCCLYRTVAYTVSFGKRWVGGEYW